MKIVRLLVGVLLMSPIVSIAQNVGVDESNPAQKLDVKGAIRLQNQNNSVGVAGSIRWNGTTLQYHDGLNWISLSSTAGTVTSVSVTTANGVSGTVTNPTSTPAISLSLGAITPSSIAATGNISTTGNVSATGTLSGFNFSGSSIGTNTGDQTITLTGPVTGSGTGSFATTITNGAVTYSKIQDIGATRILGNPTGLAAAPSEISLGTGLSFSGTTLTATGFTGNLAGDVAGPQGATVIQDNSVDGTDIALGSDASGDIIYYNGADYARLGVGSAGQVLKVSGGVPSWGSDANTVTGVTAPITLSAGNIGIVGQGSATTVLHGGAGNASFSAVVTNDVADNAITYAKMQDLVTPGLIGATAVGTPQTIGLGTGLAFSGSNLTVTGVVTSLAVDNGLTQGGTASVPTIKLGGPLTQTTTTITQDGAETFVIANASTASTVIDLQSTGDFEVKDNGAVLSALIVKDDGKVGVGTNVPSQALQVQVSNNGFNLPLYLRNKNGTQTGVNGVGIGFNSESGVTDQIKAAIYHERTGNYGVGKLHFLMNNVGDATSVSGAQITSNQVALTIQPDGNVGIGEVSPGYKLQINGKVKSTGINETSDLRLKKDINGIENASELVAALNGVTYHWRKDEFPKMGFDDKLQYGLIAQEVEKVVPELVGTDSEGWKSIEYSHLVPILLEALKEQSEEIEQLKEGQTACKNEVGTLRAEVEIMMNVFEAKLDAVSNQGTSLTAE
ncbi:MAG: tail fiber domain-containing protein [Flavobacteriales bacterium]|nr:tail fiber domain-containing protein [Flavobacteriales bacterium]